MSERSEVQIMRDIQLFSPQYLFNYPTKPYQAKKLVLSFLFKGKTKTDLEKLGKDFAEHIIPSILLPKAIEEIDKHKEKGERIIVISASLEIWLKPWAESMELELICTTMKFEDQKFSGQFASANCNGVEKVNRINAFLKIDEYSPIYAYGNSSGKYLKYSNIIFL